MAKQCKDCVVKVFGVCRGEYCQAERRGLEERAQRELKKRGHVMESFEKVKRNPIWKAQCEQCGLEVAYILDRESGEPVFSGEAFETVCTGIDS
jgi:hypothetical protein